MRVVLIIADYPLCHDTRKYGGILPAAKTPINNIASFAGITIEL